ncbi:MAG: glycerol-3-phosphate acyltransferase [Candidatus Aminicenantes bacterium]
MIIQTLAGCVSSYLLGSIPFSYMVARMVKGVDIRFVGEGNVGARNVWHVVGKKYGAAAGILDMSKGLGAYGLGILLGLSSWGVWLCGFSVVAGHDFPLFLKGRGGKGAASAMGFLLGMEPLVILISGLLMGVVYFPSRNFHLAIGIGMGSIPLLWRIILRESWAEIFLLLCFLIFLGLKRLIDEPHMRRIKKESGW